MRRDERVTVQGPVKEQQPDGLSHGGAGWTPRPCPLKGPLPPSLARPRVASMAQGVPDYRAGGFSPHAARLWGCPLPLSGPATPSLPSPQLPTSSKADVQRHHTASAPTCAHGFGYLMCGEQGTLYPPLREQRPCQSNGRCCFRSFWNRVPPCPLEMRPRVRATAGVVSVTFWDFGVALAKEGRGRYSLQGGGGGGGPSRASSLCPATFSLTANASFNGMYNRQ